MAIRGGPDLGGLEVGAWCGERHSDGTTLTEGTWRGIQVLNSPGRQATTGGA
jgi:hypothetical protein